MTLPVFLVEPTVLADAVPGGRVALSGPEGRHAVGVMRLRVGEGLDLVDGAGRRVRGEVTATAGKDRLEVAVTGVLDQPAPPVRLGLVQALAKGGRDEQAVESAVELGVDVVVPWQAARCVSRWEGPKVDKGREKWRSTVHAATKQSRRAVLPTVEAARDTPALAADVARVTAAGGLVLVLHEEGTDALADAVTGWAAATAPHASGAHDAGSAPLLAVVVGPEGGIGPEEVAVLTDAGARAVRLGPHVLRTSTAGPVALAVAADRLGLWRPAPAAGSGMPGPPASA